MESQKETMPQESSRVSHGRSRSSLSSHSNTDIKMQNEPIEASTNSVQVSEKPAANGAATPDDEEFYKPKTLKFWLVILSTFISMFLVALDRTILATAIPRITDEFKSLGDIGWYGSAYMLTTAAFQLVFGRIYRFYDLKWTFLVCIVIFEVGSAICGAAPSSPVFILGRAIAGVGSAGIMTGSMMTIIPLVPLHKRPMYQSIFGMVFGVASVTGPLLGGAFTERATWRWCFYLNLPVGVVALACLYLFEFPNQAKTKSPFKKQIIQLDPLGTFFFIPSIACLLLALQWGGSTYDWSNWRIIVLFVFFVLCAIAFASVQVLMPESASLPVRVIKQRAVLLGLFNMLFLAGAMMLIVFYIPFWFQTTHNVSPVSSGVYTLPLVLSLVVASLISGAITQKGGYYNPAMIIGPCILIVSEGLLTTFTPTTGSPQWIGYQFLAGFGIGFGMQTVGLAIQATVAKDDVATGMAIMFFAQQLGGAIFVTVGQTILSTVVVSRLQDIPGLDATSIIKAGATELHTIVPPQFMSAVLDAFNHACIMIFLTALALSACQLLTALGIPWKSIKKQQPKADEDNTQA